MKLKSLITYIFIAAAIFSASFTAQAGSITKIDNECIKLRDLFPSSLNNDNVFCGVDYGEYRKISAQHTLFLMRKYQITGYKPADVVFHRTGEKITESDIKKAVEKELATLYPDTETKVSNIKYRDDLFAESVESLKIELPRGQFGTVIAKIDNGFKTRSIPVYISAFKEGYITMSKVRKGEAFEKSVKKELIDITRVRGALVTDIKKIIASRNIGQGKVVTTNLVEVKPEMGTGALVRIIYKTDTINIAAKGSLEEDAFVGKIVRVKNIASGKIITAKYIGGRNALANF